MATSDKSSRWAFTAYEGQYPVIDSIAQSGDPLIAEMGYQDEVCPETGRKHRQGYVRTVRQVRFNALSKVLRGIHIEVARDYNALKQYCRKVETRDPEGAQVVKKFEKAKTLHELMMWMADIAWQDYEDHDRETAKHPAYPVGAEQKAQYIALTSTILLQEPEYVSIFAQPIAKNAWNDYRAVWLERSSKNREGDNSITSPTSQGPMSEILPGQVLNLDMEYTDGLVNEEEGSS